jgi:uncharacterized protein (TIRG00374 family)
MIFLKYAVGLGLLAWVGYRNWDAMHDGQQVGLSVILERSMNIRALTLGLAICAVAVGMTFVRWYVLVVAQGLPIAPRDVLRLGLIGFFFNNFLPGSVGGDVVKAAFLVREQSRRTLAVATVLLDRVIGLAGLFWMVTLIGAWLSASGTIDALFTQESARLTLQSILAASTIITLGSFGVWLFLGMIGGDRFEWIEVRLGRIPKIGPSLAELGRAIRVYRQKGRYVGLALVMSIVSHFLFVISFYLGAQVFNDADQIPPFAAHLLIVPVGTTIRSLIPLPGGVGGAELGFGKLYEWVGFPFASGVLSSLGQLGFFWILGLLGFAVYQFLDARRR